MNSHVRFENRAYIPAVDPLRVRATLAQQRTLSSQSLFEGRTEISIDHGGAIYRLKITRQGKLILNK